MEIAKHKNELLFIPLGGAGEIGMNLNLYHYKGKWLLIDMGAGFADESLPGVDMVVPDINFLIKHKKDIVGLILTHSHEDHLGAVQYLWDALECPVYATPFSSNFLRKKLLESPLKQRVVIKEVECRSKISLAPFEIDLIGLTHSAPEMHALMVSTELGHVLHTGDWKFDHDPLVGEVSDEALLEQYGREGVLALIGDSTNVFNEGTSGSEGDLRRSLVKLIASCEKMVAVTTFASNVARIETVIKAAVSCGRKVVLAGRSLHRILQAAQESGYLLGEEAFVDEKDVSNYPREKLLILCTGCQGELLAATTKIANNAHPHIKLKPGDTVIFSSKIIPGNDKKIFALFNKFVKMDIEVLTEKDHFVHVSGHPARDELKKMYQLVKPQIAVPVHGEAIHIHEHAKLAKDWGVPQAFEVENGDILRLAPNAGKLGKVHSGYLAIDGHSLLPINSAVMQMRRKISRDGIIIVTLIVSQNYNLLTDPIISSPGILDANEDKEFIIELVDEIRYIVEDNVLSLKSKSTKTTSENLYNKVREAVRRMVKRETGKRPPIEVRLEKV
jgi:ribonuclease J